MATREELVKAVLDAAVGEDGNKQLQCARALGLAKKHEVKPVDIGTICDEQRVKIVDCQLGCFGKKGK
mgnify:FL=1